MTTVSKSDKLKTKKPETDALVSGAAPGKKLPSKTRTASRTLKDSAHLNEAKSVSNEIKATKKTDLANTPNTAAKNAKIGEQKGSDRVSLNYWKSSSRLHDSKSIGNEINSTKKTALTNTPNTAAKNAKTAEQSGSDRSSLNYWKGSSRLNASRSISNELRATNKTKLAKTPNTNGSSQANSKSSPRSLSTSSQDKHASFRAKQLSKPTMVLKTTGKASTAANKAFDSITDKKFVTQKKNAVLDTPHNVTVSSPPSKRRGDPIDIASNSDQKVETSTLLRKGSRTLDPDEIRVLKKESAKMRIEEEIRKKTLQQMDREPVTGKKEPVAFEVKFEKKEKGETQNPNENPVAVDGKQRSDEETAYSDDFESYESDFETGSSTSSLLTCGAPSDESLKLSAEDAKQEDSVPQITSDDSEHEDGTEVAQRPGLEIQMGKERKLDSGNYDTSLLKANVLKPLDPALQSPQPCIGSWETRSLGTSEQMDSGISTCATSTLLFDDKKISKVVYGGYRYFYAKPIIGTRGCELKTKIQFDVLSFTLIELKPISYEIFMQTFGKINSDQTFTQTIDNQRNAEQQTEIHGVRTAWTQHPPQFVLETSNNCNKSRMCNKLVCGEVIESNENQLSYCELDRNLNAIKQLSSQSSKRIYQRRQKTPINYQRLHSFLLRSAFLMDQILGSSKTSGATSNPAHVNDQVLKHVCERTFYMETNFLNTLAVTKIFSNNKFNLLVTVHKALPDTRQSYSSNFANLLMVWCTNTCDKPIRLLTTWNEVSKVEIPNDSSDIIVAALRDGSVALWDLRETDSFCSKLDGHLTHFAATQSIVPACDLDGGTDKLEEDLGACLDVKCFKNTADNILLRPTFPTTQFASLNESGVVTVWTLVQTSEINLSLGQAQQSEQKIFDFVSPWARVKLMQSSLVNVREYLETKSAHSQSSRFDKTKDMFEKNIYSDEALRELNETAVADGRQRIRFTGLECGSENLFISTNQNFVLMCSKTLRMEKLKRIFVDESPFLFPTALKLLNSERFLAVGLCNGVVVVLNCQSDKVTRTHKELKKKSKFAKSVDDGRDSVLNNSVTSKSCAIQNILQDAQKSCEKIDANQEYCPTAAEYTTLIDSKRKSLELKLIDQQIIMSGSALTKNLTQHLELSSDGWYLFALTNGHIRVYDFYLEQEFPSEEPPPAPGTIIDLTTGTCGFKENSLMILRPNTELEVIVLKQQ